MKTILDVEKNPALIHFFQTTLGKILLIFWFGIGLKLSNFPNWLTVVLILSLVIFLGLRRLIPIAIGSIIFWLFNDEVWLTVFRKNILTVLAAKESVPSTVIGLSLIAIVICAGILIYFLLLQLEKRLKFTSTKKIYLVLGLYTGAALLIQSFAFTGVVKLLLWGLLVFMGKGIWFICYYIKSAKHENDGWIAALSAVPFWWIDRQAPVPAGLPDLKRTEVSDCQQLSVCRLKGIKLLYWCLFLKLVFKIILYVIYGTDFTLLTFLEVPSLNLPDYRELGFAIYNHLGVPFYLTWLGVFASVLKWLGLGIAVNGGIQVSIVRIMGFDIFRSSYRPLSSKTFNEFFARSMYYYNLLLTTFFFYPLWDALGGLRKKKDLRMFLAIFLTVFVGGSVYHYIRDIYFIMIYGSGDSFYQFAINQGPYFLLFGFVSATSSLFKKSRVSMPMGPAGHTLRLVGIIALYGLLLINSTPYATREKFSDRKVFMLNLIGLNQAR